jgi:hypothetical protein
MNTCIRAPAPSRASDARRFPLISPFFEVQDCVNNVEEYLQGKVASTCSVSPFPKQEA